MLRCLILVVKWRNFDTIMWHLRQFHFGGEIVAVSFWWWNCLQSLEQRLVVSVLRCFILVVKWRVDIIMRHLRQFHLGGEIGYSLFKRDWYRRCYVVSLWWWNSVISILLRDISSSFVLVAKLLWDFPSVAFGGWLWVRLWRVFYHPSPSVVGFPDLTRNPIILQNQVLSTAKIIVKCDSICVKNR